MTMPDLNWPEKNEEQIDCVENPTGRVDWRARIKKIAQIRGNRITEVVGQLGRDFCCWCPPSKQDAGMCVVGQRRVCADHALTCSVCGKPSCHRHRTMVDGLPVCHECYKPAANPLWVLFAVLGLFLIAFLIMMKGRL